MRFSPDIAAVVALMRSTDDKGRAMALGGVKGALAGYRPRAKANRCPVIDLAAWRVAKHAGGTNDPR